MKLIKIAVALTIANAFSFCARSVSGGLPSRQAPIMTRWAAEVDREKPWAEYPRPQMVRTDWLNLNGVWEYQPCAEADTAPIGKQLSGQILVPFPVESALSGVMEHHDRLWYRRNFTVPAGWAGKHLLLNFGAVDFESEVFVNGTSVGVHKGGYLPFSYDITPALKGDGPQELIVRVFNPVIAGGQPRGKQTTTPEGIMYTPSTGIWQTVWLEPVAPVFIRDLKIVPDIDAGVVKITVNSPGTGNDAAVSLKITAGGKIAKTVDGKPNTELTIPISNPELWSPDHPFLYDIEATLSGGGTTDTIKSYFGMRKISIGEENGIKKMFLNNKFLFEIGPLDQGFWPDGIYTAPTDSAIQADIQTMKDLGFNMVRKHIKVEPARWYYWTDKLGLLVWQDMPSANSYPRGDQHLPPVDRPEFESELKELVTSHWNTPSIIMWDIFNEGQGQFDTPRLVGVVKELDPSRLVNEASGGGYTGSGAVDDLHSYPPPNCPPPSSTQALVCGEYGGIGLVVKGHTWNPTGGGGYIDGGDSANLETLYGEYTNLLKSFRDDKGMSAAVYTQLTDVETELNGLMTYDRVLKVDPAAIARANHFKYQGPTYREVVATSESASQTWKYTIDSPGPAWIKSTFDDGAWKSGPGGFGTEGTPGIGKIGTTWSTDDIWLRRSVKLTGLTPEQFSHLVLREYHDEDIEVWINGIRAFAAPGYMARYEYKPISKEALAAINPDGDNVIAVHCHQTVGGQYVDVGLSERVPAKE